MSMFNGFAKLPVMLFPVTVEIRNVRTGKLLHHEVILRPRPVRIPDLPQLREAPHWLTALGQRGLRNEHLIVPAGTSVIEVPADGDE